MFEIVLTLHICGGILGLVIGPLAMYAKKNKGLHTQIGTLYFYNMIFVCISSVALAIMHWSTSWWFVFVSAFSLSLAVRGYRAVKNRGNNWLKTHISAMLGSYVALSTALLVVKASDIPGTEGIPPVIFWLMPTLLGAPLIRKVVKKNAL